MNRAAACSQCQTKRLRVDLKKCGACHISYYCDQTCQLTHWPTHKAVCQARRATHGQEQFSTEVSSKLCKRITYAVADLVDDFQKQNQTNQLEDTPLNRFRSVVSLGGVPGQTLLFEYDWQQEQEEDEKATFFKSLVLGIFSSAATTPLQISVIPTQELLNKYPFINSERFRQLHSRQWRGAVAIRSGSGGPALVQTFMLARRKS
jgi:hypothetical protein